MKATAKSIPSTTVWTGKTLSAILFVWLLCIVLQIFFNVYLMGNIDPQTGLSSFVFSAIPLYAGWRLAKKGRPKTGILFIVMMAMLGGTMAIIERGGLIVPVAQGFTTTVLLVGFIVGKRQGLISAILIALLYTALFLVESNGFIESRPTLRLDQTYLFLITRLAITATFTYFAAQAIENAFGALQERTAELSKINANLQQSEKMNAQIRQQLERSNAALEASNLALQVSETRYRTIVTSLGDAYFIARPPDARLIDANETGCNMLGYTREEMLTITGIEMNAGWSQPDFLSFYEGLHNGHNNMLRQGQYVHKAGHIIPVEVRASLIELEGEPAVFAIVRDVSERQQARSEIEASLNEKVVLLREIHHRVKNNLQVVSSLTRTSARKFPNEPLIQSELGDLASRIKSMSTIHQQLYQSNNFSQIEFATYARKLIMDIGRTHIPKSKKIALEFDLQPIKLSLESAIPAGLIINELVINAIKHGYPLEKEDGVIRCELVTDEDNHEVTLIIANDGRPFDTNDVINGRTMGMELVNRLVHQLNGKLISTIENGLSQFALSFQPREERIPR